VVLVPAIAVGAAGIPVNDGDTILDGVNVNAVVMSTDVNTTAPFLVLNDNTAPAATTLCTNAVEAICVVLVATAAVGADGMPVNVGDAILAGVNVNAVVTSADVNTIAPVLVLNSVTGADKAVTYPAGLVALYGVNVNAAVTSAAFNTIAPDLVLKVDTPDINAPTWAITNAVDASCVVLVPTVAVGAVGTPVNAGDTNCAAV
jgi:hypothetical protein